MENPELLSQFRRLKVAITRLFFVLLTLMVLFFFCPFTVTHKFGPYSGKVIDAETKEPIEGAAVLVAFYTRGVSLFNANSYYADAVETITDKNGEFFVPEHRVYAFRGSETWNYHGSISIFKPGFGCFPYNKRTFPIFIPNDSIPENNYVTINLPKLEISREKFEDYRERYENYLSCEPSSDIHMNKKIFMVKLLEEEGEYIHEYGINRRGKP